MTTDRTPAGLLATDLAPLWRRLEGARLAEFAEGFSRWREALPPQSTLAPPPLPVLLAEYLTVVVRDTLQGIYALRRRHDEFQLRVSRAGSEHERRGHLLDYARDLGATARQLAGDRKAFERWFGPDAMSERHLRRLADLERRLAFALERLGSLAALALREAGEGAAPLWERLRLERLLNPLLAYDGDERVAQRAFQALAHALRALPGRSHEDQVEAATLQYIYRSALENRQQIWIQCEALALLQTVAPQRVPEIIERRLTRPGGEDDLFVRRRAVLLLAEALRAGTPGAEPLLTLAAADPSPYVRQALAGVLAGAPAAIEAELLRRLALADPAPEVRAQALLAALPRAGEEGRLESRLACLRDALAAEADPFVLRSGLHAARLGAAALADAGLAAALAAWAGALAPVIDQLHRAAPALPVRRWAAEAREAIWCEQEPAARALRLQLEPALRALRPGRRLRLPRRYLKAIPPESFGRVLAVIAQRDFGFDVLFDWRGCLITRGHRFGLRLWRVLHELRHPSPDKRQGFRHTVGRLFRGTVQVPSGILAELAQTRVPGEPLHLAGQGGWRPWLPLPDQAISALDQPPFAGPQRTFTAEGVTELVPPASPLRRLWARIALTLHFPRIAALRNQEEPGHEPAAYAQALARLGIETRFRPHGGGDPVVLRCFPPEGEADRAGAGLRTRHAPLLLPVPLEELWVRFEDYFFSAYENSLTQLALFMAAVTALFFGRHIWVNRLIRRARRQIPLVMGGWGTRGKSGTERLKAAMLNALGYSVVSKTTGCEAMFLHAHPNGRLREMFLFRPYDKATIWEQANLVRLAARLDTDVFLWECMALNPAYVRLLQHHWMRDDLATITNAYPDHEDVQGPAGVNIPEVIAEFIPPRSRLVTSEEQMLPILAEQAKAVGTELKSVGWLEAGLLASDLLARFPYAEHPYNIALVAALGRELGIPEDYALKEMADRVVPDLGVLKVFAPAPVRGRLISFVNGMSANERHGTLSNWQRTGFDRQEPEAEPGVWITTVVNNRADRIARSRVFAAILVNDIEVDRHILIGTNLEGLLGYVAETWEAQAGELTLWPAAGAKEPTALLADWARRRRLPVSETRIRARLAVMLRALGVGREAIAAVDPLVEESWRPLLGKCEEGLRAAVEAQMARDLALFGEYREFLSQVARAAEPDAGLDRQFRELAWRWFRAKIVVIEDPHASGEQIIERIVDETPPGVHNRVMGIQNIKGTGLDFVYRWQAWDACQRACAELESSNPATARDGLRALTALQDLNLLCHEHTRAVIEAVRPRPWAQSERIQAELTMVLSRIEAAAGALHKARSAERTREAWWVRWLDHIEAFLDAGDAVKRRKQANRIYEDLATERISHERAALELQALNKRQKGGWLRERVVGVG